MIPSEKTTAQRSFSTHSRSHSWSVEERRKPQTAEFLSPAAQHILAERSGAGEEHSTIHSRTGGLPG